MSKHILFITIGFTFIFSAVKSQSTTHTGVDQLSWLEGTWNRTNSKAGNSGVEVWKRVSPTELVGRGITLKGSDTLFVEKLRIVARDGSLYYVADVPENQKPVYFKVIEHKPENFVCENPAHDFPKRIVYSLEGSKLIATISGDGKSIEYVFEKKL